MFEDRITGNSLTLSMRPSHERIVDLDQSSGVSGSHGLRLLAAVDVDSISIGFGGYVPTKDTGGLHLVRQEFKEAFAEAA